MPRGNVPVPSKPKKELASLVTSSLLRTSKLLSLSLRATTDAAALSVRTLLTGDKSGELAQKFLKDQANRLTNELGQLKGALQKAGQLFSVYGEHFLPPEVNAILKTLQKDTPPVSWDAMQKSARRTLGEERLKQLTINPVPFGSASIGQVYRTRVVGSDVEWCLKLQYPGVDRSIDSDLKTLRSLFVLLRFIPKDMNLDGIFAEIRAMLHREVDYLKEADSTAEFRTWLQDDPRFVVPMVNREFSTKRAILTSFEEGHDIDSLEVANLSQARRNALGEAFLELFFREFFVYRTVQTDPHFGNYRIRIDDLGGDRWVLLDFGAVRKFPANFVKHYRKIGESVVFHEDPTGLHNALKSLGIMSDDDNADSIQSFYEISRLIAEPFLIDAPYAWGSTGLANRVAAKVKSLLFEQGIRRPPEELIFLDRKTGGVFTILQKLNATFKTRPLLSKYLNHLI